MRMNPSSSKCEYHACKYFAESVYEGVKNVETCWQQLQTHARNRPRLCRENQIKCANIHMFAPVSPIAHARARRHPSEFFRLHPSLRPVLLERLCCPCVFHPTNARRKVTRYRTNRRLDQCKNEILLGMLRAQIWSHTACVCV